METAIASQRHRPHLVRDRGRDAAPRGGLAFTLVELLVVIAIIAALIAILLPALAKARTAARSAICLSNHRELEVAWAAYTNDYHVFPFGDPATYRIRRDWGGVNWFLNGTVPGFNLVADRPMNPYLAPDQRIDYRAAIFRCPLDTGFHDYVSGADTLSTLVSGSLSGEPDTEFGVLGNSYRANEWMYCKPGATSGWMNPANGRSNLGPDSVMVSPSRFVVLCDDGPSNWVTSTEAYRIYHDLSGEWWHGKERCPMSFLDGSARIEKTGLLVCERYSFHLLPLNPNVANSGYHWPESP